MELRSLSPVFDGPNVGSAMSNGKAVGHRRRVGSERESVGAPSAWSSLAATDGWPSGAGPAVVSRGASSKDAGWRLSSRGRLSARCPLESVGGRPIVGRRAPCGRQPGWWSGARGCGSIHARWCVAWLVVSGEHVPSNKELKLTSVERIGRSQLNSSVRRTDAARPRANEAAWPLSTDAPEEVRMGVGQGSCRARSVGVSSAIGLLHGASCPLHAK